MEDGMEPDGDLDGIDHGDLDGIALIGVGVVFTADGDLAGEAITILGTAHRYTEDIMQDIIAHITEGTTEILAMAMHTIEEEVTIHTEDVRISQIEGEETILDRKQLDVALGAP